MEPDILSWEIGGTKQFLYAYSDIEEEISETVEAEMTQRSREGDVCMCWCVYKSNYLFQYENTYVKSVEVSYSLGILGKWVKGFPYKKITVGVSVL